MNIFIKSATITTLRLTTPLKTMAGNGSGNEPHEIIKVTSIKSVYDGDTFRAYLPGYDKDQPIRVRGVDTPEIKGQCASEKKAAIIARDFVRKHLKSAKKITLRNISRDKYKRILAVVVVDEERLDKTLINNKIGRKWIGKREDWCN